MCQIEGNSASVFLSLAILIAFKVHRWHMCGRFYPRASSTLRLFFKDRSSKAIFTLIYGVPSHYELIHQSKNLLRHETQLNKNLFQTLDTSFPSSFQAFCHIYETIAKILHLICLCVSV